MVLLESDGVKVLRLLAEFLTDLVEQLPEIRGGLPCSHNGKKCVIAKRLVSFEPEIRDFKLAEAVLGPDE